MGGENGRWGVDGVGVLGEVGGGGLGDGGAS